MRVSEYFLILCSLYLNSHALNCRLDGGPKDDEVKKLYNVCIKQQSDDNNRNHGDSDRDWRESRRYNQRSQENMARNRGDGNSGYKTEENDRGEGNRMQNRDRDQNKMHRQDRGSNGRGSNGRDNRMQYDERNDDRMSVRGGRGDRQNSNGDGKYERNNGVSNRNDFFQSEDYSGYGNNQYSTQPSRRYKREKRVEVNSGKRSQYNPNTQRFTGFEDRHRDENKNSSERNSTQDDDNKACALHCLLENLEMTGENGMPDRYLVTHAIIKDVNDEDLKDFLQESIEECFQILYNENSDDKCEFSKSLLMCFSEKGRANCDDWQDDFKF